MICSVKWSILYGYWPCVLCKWNGNTFDLCFVCKCVCSFFCSWACVCVRFFRRISSICIENILFEWIIFNWCKYTTIINLGWYSANCLRSLSAMVFHWKAAPVSVSIKIIIVMDWRGFELCEFWFENSYQLEIEDTPDIIADLYLCMYTFNMYLYATDQNGRWSKCSLCICTFITIPTRCQPTAPLVYSLHLYIV